MDKRLIENARRESVSKKRSKVIRRRKKIVNLVKISLLIVGILSASMVVKNIIDRPNYFNEITLGDDYEKESEYVAGFLEKCISQCIHKKINEDTHRAVSNGDDTGHYYYNFTNYDNIADIDVIINENRFGYNEFLIISEFMNNLDVESKAALLTYYGTGFVQGEDAREQFKKHVGSVLVEKNVSNEEIKEMALEVVNELSSEVLSGHYTQGRSL